MKKLILIFAVFLFISTPFVQGASTKIERKGNITVFRDHPKSFHPKRMMLRNKIKYAKRRHQNRIFQSYIQSNMKNKGLMSDSFRPSKPLFYMFTKRRK